MFSRRLAGHSAARITRALNDAGIPCPSAADPGRNPHRTGAAWTLRTVAAILANPRYTGRQVWNRQRTDFDLVDPGNTGLGHRQVQRWNLPEGWVISKHPAHPALVSEADFIAAQDSTAPRGPAGPAARQYLLAGLLACARCGRRLESTWSSGRPAYRCRHGYTSATGTEPGRPGNTYVREDQILPHLAAIAILLAGDSRAQRNGTAQVNRPRPDRRPHRPAQSFRSRAHLRPADPHHPRRRQQPRHGHRRPEPLTPPEQQPGKGGRQAAEAPATAEGQARVTFRHARKQQLMGN